MKERELPMLYGARTPRRRDAVRNRDAILEAATELMTRRDPAIAMPEIARRAGVGQATLYRHFPDRPALAAAVVSHELDRLEAHVATRQTDFKTLLAEVLQAQLAMRPLVTLARRFDRQTRSRYLQRLMAALAVPLRQAQTAGTVRPDLVPADVALLVTMLDGILEAGDTADASRALELMLTGIFTEGR